MRQLENFHLQSCCVTTLRRIAAATNQPKIRSTTNSCHDFFCLTEGELSWWTISRARLGTMPKELNKAELMTLPDVLEPQQTWPDTARPRLVDLKSLSSGMYCHLEGGVLEISPCTTIYK
jgi:hypothetical protein